MAEIVLDRVRKVYPDGTEGVAGVDLVIPDGRLAVLVGPSGCGKTTLLRCVAGLEAITDGTVRIGDRVVNDISPKDRDLAMVFQDYALYPQMSVYDNMAFSLKLRRMPKADVRKRVDDVAHTLGPRSSCQEARPALRRAAPAGGDGPGHRARAAGVPDGRAALEPRRQAAGADARRAPPDAARPRRDDDLRHPRPDRGDDDGRHGRGHEEGRPPAGGTSPTSSTTAPPTCSSQASSARPR